MRVLVDQLVQVYEGLPEFIQSLLRKLFSSVSALADSSNRIYWLYLISSIVLAGISYFYYQNKRSSTFRFWHLLGFLFPRSVYTHASSLLDYQLYFLNQIFAFLMKPFVTIVGTAAIASWVTQQFSHLVTGYVGIGTSRWAIVAFTILYALASDFGAFINHRLHHQNSFLWPFHRVHHSAEVMNPLTLYRKHPLYDVVKSFVKTPIIGTLQGIVAFMFLGITDVYQLLGINIVFAMFNLLGANLRHTHIWVSFGPRLNYIFMSPAQHQIHHSARPEHRDRNIGEMFAI